MKLIQFNKQDLIKKSLQIIYLREHTETECTIQFKYMCKNHEPHCLKT
jgi:hypothetical protein